ncbi:MAG TPA: CvpA family protein [Terriglobia bacterium]|nr:CvpA family protein [Terriglobia bacterium]
MGAWNWLDWVMVIIMVASIIMAIGKGLVRELISLAAVVVGIIVASLEYGRAAYWFQDLTKSKEIAWAAGFLAIFALVLAAGGAASLAARFLIQQAGIEWFDRFLGGIFGLVRGLLIDSILLMVMMAFAVKPQAVEKSRLAPYVSTGARAMAYLMPGSLRNSFDQEFKKFRRAYL